MRLKKIIENLEIKSIKNFKNYNIKTITHISNDVIDSSIFLCIKGNNFDGNKYIDDAIKKGAKCVITEDEKITSESVCIIVVKDVRIAMSIVAKNFYNKCVDNMKIIGIVGTSGKTTTSLMLAQIIKQKYNKIGVIGTNGVFIDNIRLENKFTTPDPLEMHYVFYQMKMLGVDVVIMEVSAQAIYYKKVYGIIFDICVFTNISREHLDFFGSMENYARVKMNFFSSKNMRECVINIDDFYGCELAYKVDIPCISYGTENPANSFAIDMKFKLENTEFVVNILDDVIDVKIPYVGMYNVYNFLASLTVAKMLGMNVNEINDAIKNLKHIPGRFEVINVGNKKIIIDFAHTPESIEQLLLHISKYKKSKIISVFGCVGYSDRDKRIEMGEAVAKYSDSIIITTDNSGKTNFKDITIDIIDGIGYKPYVCIEDRFTAINYAYKLLSDNDILVLIGKGAEDFQTIGNKRIPYSDLDSVKKIIGEE